MESYLQIETLKTQIEYGEAIQMEGLMLSGFGTMEGAGGTGGTGSTERRLPSRSWSPGGDAATAPYCRTSQVKGGRKNLVTPSFSLFSLPAASHWL